MRKFTKIYLNLLAFLGLVFIPFTFHLFSFQQYIILGLFKPVLIYIHQLIFNKTIISFEIYSDSPLLYCLIILLFFIALVVSIILYNFKKINFNYFISHIQIISAYYVALILMKYGVYKLYKTQFYTPEPNILFTPLGILDKDILYWSTMGTSYTYNIFLGGIEILASILILYKKTRTIGLLVAIGLIANIIAVNIGFNISVKTFSFFLLYLCPIALQTQFKHLYQFFILNQSTSLLYNKNILITSNPTIYVISKTFIILLILAEAFYPQLNTNNYNNTHKPMLHGAYELIHENSDSTNLKRVFIHSHQYIIFQFKNDSMQDYKFTIDTIKNQFILENYSHYFKTLNYNYNTKDSILDLKFNNSNLYFKRLNLTQLPIFKSN